MVRLWAEEAILLALRSRDGDVRGTWVVPYGPEASAEDARVLTALRRKDAASRGPSTTPEVGAVAARGVAAAPTVHPPASPPRR